MSSHRQVLMEYQSSFRERIRFLEMEMEARRLGLHSEHAVASSQFANAMRESQARPQHGKHQLDQAHSVGNQYKAEVSELRSALLRAEKSSADRLYQFQAQSRRAEAQARIRDEEHAAQVKALFSMIANLREERDVSRIGQEDGLARTPTPVPGSNAAGPFEGPMLGSVNPTEHYNISSPPGLKPGPPLPGFGPALRRWQ